MTQKKQAGQSPPIQDKVSGADKDVIRVVSVYTGTVTASEAFHSAAVKKILYDKNHKEKVS
jgi:hypothetical protein